MKKVSLLFLIGLVSCGTPTAITGSWKTPKAQLKNYKNILVVALTGNSVAKATIEQDLSDALIRNGIIVSKGMDVIPPSFTEEKPDREAILSKVRNKGTEAIITVSLLRREAETRYIPGSPYDPALQFGYYGSFWGYYNHWSPLAYNPGYYTSSEVYFLETNFYDAQTEELLWSAQSETYNPESLSSFSKEFSTVIVARMKQDKLL